MTKETQTTASILNTDKVESIHREVNNVELHIATAGDKDDPLVVLLHGFPEFWYCWRHYIEPIAEQGYHVMAPDQRGYNQSEKPNGIDQYRREQLSRDIKELIKSTDKDKAHVIGHDWGALVAWELAMRHPGYVDKLGIINVPHPHVFQETIKSNPRQLLRSWYIYYFQIPRLPEWTIKKLGYRPLERAMTEPANKDTFTKRDIEIYKSAWSQPNALTSMINWYRALRKQSHEPSKTTVDQPIMIIWGEKDQALIPKMAEKSMNHCSDAELHRYPDASHWIPHEKPETVRELILEHIQ